ncbi:hypothetical protein XF24_00891 [candidate division SR1 bacterium Aalborg_AAW-1]|nr:hypothetical protein XF24_00891 [candidate division SR1 bacterium Aalborg_AAW-1]
MKILLCVPEYPPHHVGGGGPVFHALAQEYTKLGHEVMVIYGYYPTKHGFESLKQYTEYGIQFVQVPLLPTPRFTSFLKTVLPTGPWNLSKLRNIIRDFQPEKAHLHGYGLMFINQLAKIIVDQKIPYIYTLHGAPVSADKKGGIIQKVYNLYKHTWGKFILDHASDITAVSQYTIDNFSEFHPYKDRIRIVPNGIYPEEFAKQIDYNIYDQYNVPEGSTIYLSIGRIERRKGHDKFIKMIPSLVESGVDVRYFIAGQDNGYKQVLDSLSQELGVSERIYYLGFVSGDDKLSMLQHADYVIFPSEKETFGLVTLEAMASGTTPIINNIGGFVDIVQDGKNGIIVNFSRVEEYRGLIGKNINKDVMRGTVQYYNWKKIAINYLG